MNTSLETLIASTLFAAASVLVGCADDGAVDDAGASGDSDIAFDASSRQCTGQVLAAGVTNAREVGGLALEGNSKLACRRLFRGGDLSRLDEAGCAELQELGIETVIDLRMPSTQKSAPATPCAADQAVLVSAPMPKLLPDTAENYLALFDETEALDTVFSALGSAEHTPAFYVHCVIGRDRASFVTALVLKALGADDQSVLEEFQLSAELGGVPVHPESLEAVLDELDRRGGAEAYLTETVGVDPDVLARIRALLAEP